MWDEKKMAKAMTPANFLGADVQTCCMCGEGRATRTIAVQEFTYGSGSDAVILHAQVPIWSCETCELEYVDAEGERAQHDAVCRHLGRLTPSEIKAFRVGTKMTQKDFATEIGCGSASLKRWELGMVVQGRIADNAIRDFQKKLKRSNPPVPSFRTELSSAQRVAAPLFVLRACNRPTAPAA